MTMNRNYLLLFGLLLFGCSQAVGQVPEERAQKSTLQEGHETVRPSEDSQPSQQGDSLEKVPDRADQTDEGTDKPVEDNSTPIKAIHNYIYGIVDGNVERAKSAMVMNNEVEVFLLSNIEIIRAMDEYAKVDQEHFGEGGMPVGFLGQAMLSRLENIEPVMIGDDRAECMISPPNPLDLVKSPDGWKVDLTGETELLESGSKAFNKTAKMMDQVREKILDGTIASRAESREELKRLRREFGL